MKPVWSNILAGDNTLWVLRNTTAQRRDPLPEPKADGRPPITWFEPLLFDVFRMDGAYMGEARVPARTFPMVVGDDTAWGVRRGEFDEQYVVRLRLRRARSPSETESGDD